MGGVRILRNRKLGFSRLQGFLRTFNYSRQTHLRVMHLFFLRLKKNNTFLEHVTKAENRNCQNWRVLTFVWIDIWLWALKLWAITTKSVNTMVISGNFVLLKGFIQTVINDWLSFLWYVKCPSQGWTSWTFYPFAPQRTVRRILCALTYCLWHALRLFLYLQLCFVPHK